MNGIPTAKTGETKPSNFCSSTSERTKSQPRLKRRRNRKPEAPKGKRRTGDATATNELRPSTAAAASSAPLSSSSLPSDATRANPSPHCERVEAARTEALEEVATKETRAPKQLKPPWLRGSLSATTTSSTSRRPRPPQQQHRPDRRRPRNLPSSPFRLFQYYNYATLWMGKRI
jgi:hypothetical protein